MAYRSASSNSSAGTTSLSVTAPSGLSSGDVLVAGVTHRSSATLTAPSGWVQTGTTETIGNDKSSVWYKVAGGSEPGSYSWGLSASNRISVTMAAFTGIDNTTPIDVGPSQATGSSTTATATTITPTGSGQDLVALFGSSSGGATITWTAPSGMTERADVAGDRGSSTLDTEVFTSGATGSRAATLSSTATWAAFLLALKAASSASAPHSLLLCFP